MAKLDCNKIANMIATWLIAWDDDLAKAIADISLEKRIALSRAKWLAEDAVDEVTGATWHTLQLKAQSADIKLRAITQAKILTGDLQIWWAYEQLVKEIKKTWGSLSTWIDLLEKVKNADVSDLKEIVKLWWEWLDIKSTIKTIEEKISAFVSSNYSIKQHLEELESWLWKINKWIREWTIKPEDATKALEDMEAEALKKVKEWGNPSWLAKLDEEWTTIKKIAWEDKDKAWELWNQYILAKELLSNWGIDDWVLNILKHIFIAKDLAWKITYNDIVKTTSLDKLMAMAYLNTKQLCEDGLLRKKFRERLIALSSSIPMWPDDVNRVESLINTLQFAQHWASFSNVIKYDNVKRVAQWLWYKVEDWQRLYQALHNFVIKLETKKSKIPNKINLAWKDYTPQDVIQLIYAATQDNNIIKLLNAGNFTDDIVLDISTKYFLNDTDNAAKKILALFTKAKDWANISNVQDLELKAITWLEIKEWAPKAFYDFRDWLYIQDELNRARANFREEISNTNKMRLSWEWITDLTWYKNEEELIDELKKLKGWYLITNDVRYRDNEVLKEALYKVNKDLSEEEKIKVLFPRWALMANFRMEWWDLVFRTTSAKVFDDVASTISIQTLWEAKPTREVVATATEMVTGRNSDKIRFQASYEKWAVNNVWESISDQQASYFANSKARDEDGNLIKFWHWTSEDFTVFDIETARKNSDIQWMFFSEYEEEVRWYWPNVWAYYLNIENPAPAWEAYEVFKSFEWQNDRWVLTREELQRRWYDWVQAFSWEWIVFSPEQIKSVDNKLPTTDPDVRFEVKGNEQWYLLPTEKEYDEFLKTHDVDKELKEMFWTTNDPSQAIFITKDWEFISWYWLPDDKYKTYWWIQVEHWGALMALLYWDRSFITNWEWAFKLMWGQTLIDMFEKKTWIIRVRPSAKWYAIQLWWNKITKQQEYALREILEDFNKNIHQDKELFIESWQSWQNFRLTREFDNSTWVYTIDNVKELVWRIRNEKYFEGLVESHNKEVLGKWVWRRMGEYVTSPNTKWQLKWTSTDWEIWASNAVKISKFTKWRTFQEIADFYWVDIKYVNSICTPEWLEAYWAYWDWIIYFADIVKKSTPPHELFHAVFDMVDSSTYRKILDDAMTYTWETQVKVEERLAEAFADYFNTWEFKYLDAFIKTQESISKAKKKPRGWMSRIKALFKNIKNYILWMQNHQQDVKKLFDDIINMQYLPDDGKPINQLKATIDYDSELEQAANKYFWEMLGYSHWEKVDKEYIDRVQTALSEKTWIPVEAFENINDRAALWQMVDDKFALEKLTTGKYDREIVDIWNVVKAINWMSDDELAKDIAKDLWDIINADTIRSSWNIAQIRDAYIDYKTSATAVDNLQAKGRIISLANGWSAETLTMDTIKDMFANWTFADTYKNMFFPNQDVSEKDMERFIRQINDNIFDTLSNQFASNLVDAWYSLPLVNIRDMVYDYLTWNLNLNSDFASAFFTKNNIPYTSDNINALVDNFMPSEFKFWYEDALYRIRDYNEMTGNKSVYKQTKNNFVQDTYSSLVAISNAKAWTMPQWQEETILTSILDKYSEAFRKGLDEWNLTFEKAQQIKQEASYALDMFEQDFILPKYGRFLTQSERQWLMGMKYSLPIAVNWMNKNDIIREIENTRNRLIQRYNETLKWAAANNDINMAIVNKMKGDSKKMTEQIKQREQKLMEQGWVIRDVWWEYVVVDSRQALKDTLESLPKTIRWFEDFKNLWNAWIERLSNSQVYVLLKYVEAAKQADTMLNYATELMYKQNPNLLRYNFFSSFKVEDWLPRALKGNLLNWNSIVNKLNNTSWIDTSIKKWIFADIISEFKTNWYLDAKKYDKLIRKNIDNNIENLISPLKDKSKRTRDNLRDSMIITYTNAFAPYKYVRDIPSWWTLLDWTKLVDVKWRIEKMMKLHIEQVKAALKSSWMSDLWLERRISIMSNDWTRTTLEDAVNGWIDWWKKNIFNDESIFVKWADEVWVPVLDPTKEITERERNQLIKEEKEYREKITNDYNATLQQIMNWWQIITDWERNLMSSVLHDTRAKLRRYTLTNKLLDWLDILSWVNEEAARWIKDYLIWFTWQLTFWSFNSKQIVKRLWDVKEAYARFYPLSIARLNWVKPTTKAEDLALKLAKYFKQLERQLGSADWLTWVTTRENINRAFYHIGETFLNIRDERWVFAMLSAIEQNQVLKFFKFSNPNQISYVPEFIRRWNWVREYWVLWWYRDYVEEISWITATEFNQIFWTAFDESEFKQILQGLTWFTLTWSMWRFWRQVLNFLWGSHLIFRMLMSYPWQLLTIPQQSIAYFFKLIGNEDFLWVESLSTVDRIREESWVLNWAYNEISIFNRMFVNPDDVRPNNYYNRYGMPDVTKVYWNTNMQYSDDILWMYAKIDNYWASSNSATSWWIRQLDPYKDNANNIIDWLFSRNFKNVAFTKALRTNDFMQFWSAQAFKDFMDDPTVSQAIKDRLLDRVSATAWRNFRNILWLWFGWIDRPIAWRSFRNIMYWLMQLFNFRWAWWQTIFKQTGEAILTWLKMAKTANLSSEGKTMVARFIATQPEFLNFVWAVLNDMIWCWKLTKYQDNWRRPEEDEYSAMDFLEYMRENLDMASQWWQGIQSFWPARPIIEQAESIIQHKQNPTVYKDTYWLWAFFNSLGKNFGRQWKVQNWLAKALWALTTDWWWGFTTYVQNEFWKLSFWSLRYMMDEDSNSYWLTYELSGQVWWIPSIIAGEAARGWDKTFSYDIDSSETWETMKQLFDWNLTADEKWTYAWNLWKTLVNGSQMFSLPKNLMKAINRSAPSYYTNEDLSDLLLKTEAGKEFYSKGYVTPRSVQEAKIFYETMTTNWKYRPGSSNFTKSITQFELFWHMDWKEWKEADAEMELWLNHMKYDTLENWSYVSKNWKKVESEAWKNLMINIKAFANDEDYVINQIYNFSVDWLNTHQSDPNYQLYVKLLWQWRAVMLYEDSISDYIDRYNKTFGLRKTDKLTKEELKNSWQQWDILYRLGNTIVPWESKTLFDKMQVLDQDASTAAALAIIQDQVTSEADKNALSKFFTVKEWDEWELNITMDNQYKSQLLQLWAISRAIDEGNLERALAEAATITHTFSNADPSWAVTVSLLDSITNRINSTPNLSDKQKIEAVAALFHDNIEFIQKNADKMRAVMWSDYDIYADYINSILYRWDWDTISNMLSMQAKWSEWSSSWTKKAIKLSSDLKKAMQKIAWENYWGNSTWWGSTYKQWVPVEISWAELVRELWVKWYTPTQDKISLKWWKPTVDFWISKDVKRKTKNPSTKITSSKTLTKLEDKAEKASAWE